tara:strand:+ start:202 stop:747 length:546 start_codon:yes stop_codon:yes gene_type:complete
MSQKVLDILRGISQAAAGMYDGAHDENGEPIKIGLKREEGNPNIDKRVIDGCKIRCSGKTLIVSYHSELMLSDVYNPQKKLESELEQTMADIVKYLKKQYRKVTGNSLGLKARGEVDANVFSTSRKRVDVTAQKLYDITSMDGVESVDEPSRENLENNFKAFLELGDLGKRAKNDKRKAQG